MATLQALLLGIVQGLAEYLPISSSGHLEIAQGLLGLDLSGADSLQFDIMLHVATVLSTIVILWREFSGMCVSFFTLKKDENTSLVCKILVSCIPVGIVGLFFKDSIEQFYGHNLTVVGTCLLVTAALLAFAYYSRTRSLIKKSGTDGSASIGRPISYVDAFVIGCAQAVAVLPGLSRSGSTIATGIMLGDRRDSVARFSFLMVIIPILGQAFLDLVKGMKDGGFDSSVGFMPMFVGFMASFIVGCIACKWMLEIVRRGRLVWFAVYCAIVGAVCLIFQ